MASDVAPVSSPDELGRFALEYEFCWACGAGFDNCHEANLSARLRCSYSGPFRLDIHHIVKKGRSDERCNLSRLCSRCHAVVDGGMKIRQTATGIQLPDLKLIHILWLKRSHDPRNYDPKRLAVLWRRQAIPMSHQPAQFYLDSYYERRGTLHSWKKWKVKGQP